MHKDHVEVGFLPQLGQIVANVLFILLSQWLHTNHVFVPNTIIVEINTF